MYDGSYLNDKKSGFGVYVWADGRAYVGDWEDGKQKDERVYILPNGTVRKGRWEGGARKEWLEISEEEKERCKAYLENARQKAKEVEQIRRQATNEVEEIIRGQSLRAQKHEQEKLPEGNQVIQEIE